MAASVGRTDPSVAERLLESPFDFEFFQAVRLLASMNPARRLISGFGQPHDELVRFHAHTSMTFAASAIQHLQPDSKDNGPHHMTVNFMGLTGPMGALPTHYTEYAIARGLAKDNTLAAFLDIFNHRLISLFYLAWEKHNFQIAYEREAVSLAPPRFTQFLFDLFGMGTGGLRGQLDLNDSALLSYSGLLAQRPHSAAALAGILRDYFQVPVEIEQFVGKWCALEDDCRSYLDAQGDYGRLGAGAIAGDQVWNQQAGFRVSVGPLDWHRFNCFLPGSPALRELVAMTGYFSNRAFHFDVQLILLAADVRPCEVLDEPESPRLGLSSWLATEPFRENARDTVITVHPSGAL